MYVVLVIIQTTEQLCSYELSKNIVHILNVANTKYRLFFEVVVPDGSVESLVVSKVLYFSFLKGHWNRVLLILKLPY